MSYDLIIAISLGVIMLYALWLRTNIALGILALTAGYTLSSLVSDDIFNLMYKNGVESDNLPLISIISIVITLVPAVLILMRFKNYQPGRLLVHISPAFGFALLAMLFVLVGLPFDVQKTLREESFTFGQFEYFESVIVIGAVIISIFDLMAHEKKLRRKSRRRRRSSLDD